MKHQLAGPLDDRDSMHLKLKWIEERLGGYGSAAAGHHLGLF